MRNVRFISLAPMIALLLASAGCQKESSRGTPNAGVPSSGTPATTVVVDTEPAEVELIKAKAVLDEFGIARFEIDYKFISGKPVKHYLVEIKFPGTDHVAGKPLDPGELDPEGTITTGIEVGDRPVETYEMTMSEADSPQAGYTLISNTLTGTIEKADAESDAKP